MIRAMAIAAAAVLAPAIALGAPSSKPPPPGKCVGEGDWHGTWVTVCHRGKPCGELSILQDGDNISGTFRSPAPTGFLPGWIEGRVTKDNRVLGRWYTFGRENEVSHKGDLEFRLRPGKKAFRGVHTHGDEGPRDMQWDGRYKGPPSCKRGDQV